MQRRNCRCVDALRRICAVRTLFIALFLTATASAAAETRALASDGRDFLALWDSQGLHASIILDTGGVGRSIQLGTRKTIDAAAAWNGETYVVAWIEVEGANPYNYAYFARWARLSASGELLDVFDNHAVNAQTVGIAANGANTLIAWAPGRVFSIVLDLIGRDGHVIHETSVPYYLPSFPHLFADGSGFIVFVLDQMFYGVGEVPPGPWRVTAQRVDSGGNAVGDQMVDVDDYTYAPGNFGVARSGGTEFMLARTIASPSYDPSRSAALRTRRISGDLTYSVWQWELQLPAGFSDTGLVCDAVCTAYVQGGHSDGGAVLTLHAGPTAPGVPILFLWNASFPRVASNGRKILVLWDDRGELKSLECDSTLQPLPGATPQPVVRTDRRRATRP